jgi:hypothetical protein
MLVYILIGVLLAVIVYMIWSVMMREKQMKRVDRYYTENIMPVYEYPAYNGWWWPGTSVIYGTGGWWRPPFWRGVDRDWSSGWQPGHISPRWRGGGFSYQPTSMPGSRGGHHPGGLPGMGGGVPKPAPTVSVPSGTVTGGHGGGSDGGGGHGGGGKGGGH